MRTPVVTMKVDPKELQLIDAALEFLSRMAALTIKTLTTLDTAGDPLPSDTIVEYVDKISLAIADGDLARVARMSNSLRKSMDMS